VPRSDPARTESGDGPILGAARPTADDRVSDG